MSTESFENIVGGTEEDKIQTSEILEMSSVKTGEELFGENIIEATESETNAIFLAVEFANKIAQHYGSNITTDPGRVFVLKEGSVQQLTHNEEEGSLAQGYSNRWTQAIAVERSVSDALLAKTVAHEALHLATPFVVQINVEDNSVEDYRGGLSMFGRKGEGVYFASAEEAIVETLSKRFFDEVITVNPKYSEDVARTDEIKEIILSVINELFTDAEHCNKLIAKINDILFLPDNEDVLSYLNNTEKSNIDKYEYFIGFYNDELQSGSVSLSREEEREKFNDTLDHLIKVSNGELGTKDELFDEFARAHFTGTYLPIGHKIDKVLGKGSFRKIAIELGEMKNTKD